MEQIYFQSSLPRAGSTVLQNILAQNPDFYASPTSGLIELLNSAKGSYSQDSAMLAQDADLMKKGWINFCSEGLKGFYNGITDKKYIIDKSRGWGVHYNWLNKFYPDPKIVCMVRDVRAIYTSMEKNYRKHPEKESGVVKWGELKGTTTSKRVDIWAQSPPVGLSMDRLEDLITQGIDKHILFIRFEDLTLYPQKELNRVYDFFGLDRYQHDFQNIEQITQEDDKIHGIFGDHTIRPQLKPVPNKWNDILGKELSENIVNTYPWFYKYFNYNI
tara:strand:- start:935 stop:1753 length:819 start_codon:yes stop_codon:yes gene_type:complete